MPRRAPPTIRRIEITSAADRHTLEALQLEIRRLARQHGLDVIDVQITDVEDGRRPRSD
jgi:ABC-type uncharacterized transport system substrate-binding protein